jgi:polar amino acid transport system substrate-binding protein
LNFGWSYGESIDTGRKSGAFVVEESKDNKTSFKKLIRGRVDCIIVDELAASQIIYQQHLMDQVEKLTIAATVNKTYVAFPKSFKNKSLVDNFNKALLAMKADGSYERIVDEFIKQSLAK